MNESILYLLTFVVSLIASHIITGRYRHYALNKGVIDHPNQRSSHSLPTPRGGGISIIIICNLLIVLGVVTNQLDSRAGIAILVSSSIVASVGFIDDHQHLSSRIRLTAHLLASFCGLLLLPELPSLHIMDAEIEISGAGIAITTIALAWLINLYNFMDGIDGIAASEAIATLLGAAAILSLHSPQQGLPLVLLTAPIIGFLIWNWAPAKIFMGDGSSGYLGMILGLTGIYYATHSPLNLWCWMILLGVFVVDSSWTLAIRVITGQSWHQPHRSHCYQILSRTYNSHARVSMGTVVITTLWLTPIAAFASFHPSQGFLLLAISYLPLICLCIRNKAGTPS